MKFELYTQGHRPDLVQALGKSGCPLTGDEHAFLTAAEHAGRFSSKDKLLHWFMTTQGKKLALLPFLLTFMERHGVRSVLSLGAGPCVLESLLARAAPPGVPVSATDYDGFLIKNTQNYFPELQARQHDFVAQSIAALGEGAAVPDLAVFIGSSYVMDDAVFIQRFTELRRLGARWVIDFQGAYLSPWACLRQCNPLARMKRWPRLRAFFGKGPLGQFHGYMRTRGDWRRLYHAAGWAVKEECSVGPYAYVAVCGVPANPSI